MTTLTDDYLLEVADAEDDFGSFRFAKELMNRLLKDPSDLSIIDWLPLKVEERNETYQWAISAYQSLELMIQKHLEDHGEQMDEMARTNWELQRKLLPLEAKRYFERRIVGDTKDDHIADILVEMERLLEDQTNPPYYLEALESVRSSAENKIERQRRRAKIREEIKMFDEPMETKPPESVGDRFTRKQVIFLLQHLIPEFKHADNTRKAAFISKLTGWKATKSIADEFSNISNFENNQLLEEWREKLKSTGRGRKRKEPSTR